MRLPVGRQGPIYSSLLYKNYEIKSILTTGDNILALFSTSDNIISVRHNFIRKENADEYSVVVVQTKCCHFNNGEQRILAGLCYFHLSYFSAQLFIL
jgi:hypothetical protein